jgi:hypothetical protein
MKSGTDVQQYARRWYSAHSSGRSARSSEYGITGSLKSICCKPENSEDFTKISHHSILPLYARKSSGQNKKYIEGVYLGRQIR